MLESPAYWQLENLWHVMATGVQTDNAFTLIDQVVAARPGGGLESELANGFAQVQNAHMGRLYPLRARWVGLVVVPVMLLVTINIHQARVEVRLTNTKRAGVDDLSKQVQKHDAEDVVGMMQQTEMLFIGPPPVILSCEAFFTSIEARLQRKTLQSPIGWGHCSIKLNLQLVF